MHLIDIMVNLLAEYDKQSQQPSRLTSSSAMAKRPLELGDF